MKPDVPYKTLLLSTGDTVAYVVRETLEKYGLEKEDASNYCLVQVRVNYSHIYIYALCKYIYLANLS